ncbi:MAG TPA: glycosyltransferase family 39 protein [Bryobacteraceae bacterium]|nr:glycosyltransferase family 39 protein [Bryobacteraceae bacterium]
MQRVFWGVTLLALACLLLRSARVGLAGDYVDPIGRITAQDEAPYANSAIRMARQGDWLTPFFMGRYALYKPPFLMWAAGLSARILGVSRLALRLPVALLASLGLGLVFLWVAELRSVAAAACAAVLLASNHLWHVLGGMCMTDGILVAFCIAAMYCLYSDPWLESKWVLWGFAGSVAGAILTKSVAGLLPLGVLGLYCLAVRREERPRLTRVWMAVGLSLALAAPWFLYQAIAHSRWFWAEHIDLELLAFGAGSPPQTSQENQALFYLTRVPGVDPVLTALALLAMPGLLSELRKRSGPAVLLACWMVMVAAEVLAFQYRNVSYVLPMIPALAILAAGYGSNPFGRRAAGMAPLLVVAFVAKAAFPTAPWGLSFEQGTIQPVAPIVSEYCERARSHELIVVDLADDLYASTLPLHRLRYCLVGADVKGGRYGMPFDYMGIVLTAAQFGDAAQWTPIFRQRLSEWGIDSDEPIGTLITAKSPAELAEMIRTHPESDFLIPRKIRPAVEEAAQDNHEIVEAPGYFFLLSRDTGTVGSAVGWSCRL